LYAQNKHLRGARRVCNLTGKFSRRFRRKSDRRGEHCSPVDNREKTRPSAGLTGRATLSWHPNTLKLAESPIAAFRRNSWPSGRRTASVSDVVGAGSVESSKSGRRGAAEWKGHSRPSTRERSPSFFVKTTRRVSTRTSSGQAPATSWLVMDTRAGAVPKGTFERARPPLGGTSAVPKDVRQEPTRGASPPHPAQTVMGARPQSLRKGRRLASRRGGRQGGGGGLSRQNRSLDPATQTQVPH